MCSLTWAMSWERFLGEDFAFKTRILKLAAKIYKMNRNFSLKLSYDGLTCTSA